MATTENNAKKSEGDPTSSMPNPIMRQLGDPERNLTPLFIASAGLFALFGATLDTVKLDAPTVSLLPLELLTAGNLIRVVGDLILVGYNSVIVNVFVGLSGWLILIAVIAFLLKLIPLASPANRVAFLGKNSIMTKRKQLIQLKENSKHQQRE